jgi:hypothetical protein
MPYYSLYPSLFERIDSDIEDIDPSSMVQLEFPTKVEVGIHELLVLLVGIIVVFMRSTPSHRNLL